MDVRQEQLIAAAGAMRAWVSAQRASWDRPYPAPAMAGTQTTALPAVLGADTASPPAISTPAVDRTAGLRVAWGRVQQILSRPLPISVRSARVAVAAVLVLLCVGAARVYGPTWTRTIENEVAVGRTVVSKGRGVVARGKRASREVVEKGRRVVGAAVGASVAEKPAAAAATGALQIETDPVGAKIIIDGQDRGVSPLTINDLAPGSYDVLLQTGAGSVQRRVLVTAGQTATVTEGIFSGWLRVNSPIDVLVSEQGRGLQLDERGQVLLSPGRHELLIENRDLGFREVRRVDVRPGDTTSITLELPVSLLSVTTTENAEIFVDGKLAGITPLTDYAVVVGTREITVQADSGSVRRITVRMTKEPMRLHVDLSAP